MSGFPARLRSRLRASILLCLACTGIGLAQPTPWETSQPIHGVRVVASFPHDPEAFTQGLAIRDGKLYESTGNYGESVVRHVELSTGRVLQQTDLTPDLFGEGITLWGDRLVQLTWREGKGLVYEQASLRRERSFAIDGEGWGITQDDRHWIISDGTEVLRFLDPATLALIRRVRVLDADRPVRYLNELEYVEGQVWANIWHNDMIARIDPDSGQVLGYIDLSGLYPKAQRQNRHQVLNGIAYDPASGRLFVTGKNWPRLYEIRVLEPAVGLRQGPGP